MCLLMQDVTHSLKLTTGPATEPVSLSEAKLHCRREDDFTAEDDLFTELIKAARELVETDTERAFIEQTWTLTLDRFPDVIELRKCPIFDAADVEITYLDSDGDSQTLSTDDYRVDASSEPGRIATAYGVAWPLTYNVTNAITVEFTAGYADSSLVPSIAKQAIKLLVGHWYRNREAVGQVGEEISLAYNSLIERLRWGGYR